MIPQPRQHVVMSLQLYQLYGPSRDHQMQEMKFLVSKDLALKTKCMNRKLSNAREAVAHKNKMKVRSRQVDVADPQMLMSYGYF